MTLIRDMTDAETSIHIRKWMSETHNHFAWPTDACGYDQHIRFVEHRNANWHGSTEAEWRKFVLDYAEELV